MKEMCFFQDRLGCPQDHAKENGVYRGEDWWVVLQGHVVVKKTGLSINYGLSFVFQLQTKATIPSRGFPSKTLFPLFGLIFFPLLPLLGDSSGNPYLFHGLCLEISQENDPPPSRRHVLRQPPWPLIHQRSG